MSFRVGIILIVCILFVSCNNDTRENTEKGKQLLLSGKKQESILVFNESINKNPKDTFAFLFRGRANLDLGNFKDAASDFSEVIELNKDAFFAKYYRGMCFGVLKEWEQGYRDLDFVISSSRFHENDPENSFTDSQRSLAYSSRGICAVAIGNIQQAVNDLKHAKQYDSNNDFIKDLSKFLGVKSVEGTIDCLLNYDWIYPLTNPIAAWKFNSKGTFNFSTKLFGGQSAWGLWEVSEPGRINLIYTRTTDGSIPSNQVLQMNSCENLEVGSSIYFKK
jgi:tetratricopeptide (TPR) repeat protein